MQSLAHRTVTGEAPQPDCPTEAVLAEYLEGNVDTGSRTALERHLAGCGACREVLGAVLRIELVAQSAEAVPEFWLARALRLVRNQRANRSAVWAVAATALLAIGLSVVLSSPRPSGSSEAFETRQSRFARDDRQIPHIAEPSDLAAIAEDDLEVEWSGVPGAKFYEVRIVGDDGDLVIEERVKGTEWIPRAPLGLTVGAEYFVQVDAYVDEAKPQSSAHVLFKVVR